MKAFTAELEASLTEFGFMPKKHHKIKISPEFFWQVFKGEKTFQIRKNDRDYRTGDKISFYEFNGHSYTGYALSADIGFMTNFKQQPGYVVFSLHNVRWFRRREANEKEKKSALQGGL